MELDKRIEKLSDILTCFDTQKAGQFLGQKGYFMDVYSSFQNLDNRAYGILTAIRDSDCSFKMGNNEYWRFFIPESRLKPGKPVEKYDEISILKYKVEKLEKNLIELQRKLNSQETMCNPFTPWTNCCNSIMYSDGFNPQANWCKNLE